MFNNDNTRVSMWAWIRSTAFKPSSEQTRLQPALILYGLKQYF